MATLPEEHDDAPLRALRARLPRGRVHTARWFVQRYAYDALDRFRGHRVYRKVHPHPQAVVTPRTTGEVVTLVRWAREHRIPLIPWGAGTNVMGAALAERGGVVVDLSRMDRILRISREDRTATVQPGVVLEALERALNEHGLILGHDPWSRPLATVGGALGTDGHGYRAAKYGSMGDQVLGLEAVLGTGEVLRLPGVPKRNTGPDLVRLFVGAEGTLGIVTQVTLRVFPRPEARQVRLYRFPDFETGYGAVLELAGIGLIPALLDLYEEARKGGPVTELVIGHEGFAEEVEAYLARIDAVCRRAGGVPGPQREADAYWQHRHRLARWFKRYRRLVRGPLGPALGETAQAVLSRMKIEYLHVALPAGQVLPFRRWALDVAAGEGLRIRETAVWTAPELFSLVLEDPQGDPERVLRGADRILEGAVAFGGSLEYCHGVGLRLRPHLERALGPEGVAALGRLKAAFDPDGILNPGKLAPEAEG